MSIDQNPMDIIIIIIRIILLLFSLTLLLGLNIASPCSILLSILCASIKDTFMNDGWTITLFIYPKITKN